MASVAVVVSLSATGCGGSAATTHAPGQSPATATATATGAAPTSAESASYVRGLIPAYEDKIKARGGDLFGHVTVQCAATGGPGVECLVEIPYRRMKTCAKAKGSVFVEKTSSGVQQSNRSGNGQLDLIQQVCYIGRNGEPVPSRP